MRLNLPALFAALFALAVAAPAVAQAQSFSPDQRGEIERLVRDYLLRNPEVLQEALIELEKRQTAAEMEKGREAVKQNAAVIFNSQHQVVLGNPAGDTTLVEFFDYNCGYCKRALTDMLELMKSDPKLRVVLKEFPVLGDGSVAAAQIAVSVRTQDKTGKKYLEFHQRLFGSRGAVDKARALAVVREIGLDAGRAEREMDSAEARAAIEEGRRLAQALGINGTPSYVIGTDVIIGAVGLDKLRTSINTARCGQATC